MLLKQEELFHFPAKVNMLVITTNGVITNAGKLVMGRGCAKELKDKLPGIDTEIANLIIENRLTEHREERTQDGKKHPCHFYNYGFLVVRSPLETGRTGIGIFQVKECWWEDAQLWLIQQSAKMLKFFADEHPGIKIRMPLAGCGNGRLSKDKVIPILETLPDSVTVCYR